MRFTVNNINNPHEGGKKWEKNVRRAVIFARFSIKGVNKINHSTAETSYTQESNYVIEEMPVTHYGCAETSDVSAGWMQDILRFREKI